MIEEDIAVPVRGCDPGEPGDTGPPGIGIPRHVVAPYSPFDIGVTAIDALINVSKVPTGCIMLFPDIWGRYVHPPDGWLWLNGKPLSIKEHPALYDIMVDRFDSDNPDSTVHLPYMEPIRLGRFGHMSYIIKT